MIHSVTIRRFKRFEEITFVLKGRHIVLAGPNNMGKTTILQAVSAWTLAFRKWKERNDFRKYGGKDLNLTYQVAAAVSSRC